LFLFRPLFVPAHTFQRISAPPKGIERCKLSVTAEAASQFSTSLPPEKLSPFFDHFHPTAVPIGHSIYRPENRRRGTPFLAVNVLPHVEQVCHVQCPSLNPLIGNLGNRQGQVGPVGLYSSSIICPQVDPITEGNRFPRPGCRGTPQCAHGQRAPPRAARRRSPNDKTLDAL
jgi:hypothetical protein